MIDKKLNKAFAKVLKRLRDSHELSQEKLAFQCNLHRTFISQLENGQKTPTLLTVRKISRVFGLKASEMVQQVEEELESKKVCKV